LFRYRKKLLYGELDDFLKTVVFDIEKKADFEIIEVKTDKDHILIVKKSLK
jgi:REP element-mobilizing transposase RayT